MPTLFVVFAPSCEPDEIEEPPAVADSSEPIERARVHAAEPAHDGEDAPEEDPPADDDATAESGAPDPADAAEAAAPGDDHEARPPEPAEAPIGVRAAGRTVYALAAPRRGSDLRGRIDLGSTFAIYELVDGPDCPGEGWARVDHDSYLCLKSATESTSPPVQQPVVPEGMIVPFIYARPKADRRGNLLAEIPRYKNQAAYVHKKDPVDYLGPHRKYAFVEEIPIPGHGKVLRDAEDQIVPIVDGLKFEKPSEFSGRLLAERPVPPGLAPAWAISHEAVLRRQPKLSAPIQGRVEYHHPLDVNPEPQRGGGARWIEIPDAYGPGVPGYVEADKVRVWTPGLPFPEMGEGDLWIDIDLGTQTLALMRGQEAQFITLISSGTGHKPNTATPKGIYRIRLKVAHGPMRNRPEDAEDSPYHVEAVPWVQYFYKRFALHASYWHNGFGHRKSHGCVNLSPRDARYIFEQTGPALPPGWMTVYEHADRPGTVIRVRKGAEPVPDRRTEHDEPDDEALLARAVEPLP